MPVGEFAIMLLREEKKGRTWDSTVRWELMVNKQRAKGFRTFLRVSICFYFIGLLNTR